MKHVAAVAETIGVNVIEDEVDIGTAWDDVLEVVERKGGLWNRESRLKALKTLKRAHTDGWTFV